MNEEREWEVTHLISVSASASDANASNNHDIERTNSTESYYQLQVVPKDDRSIPNNSSKQSKESTSELTGEALNSTSKRNRTVTILIILMILLVVGIVFLMSSGERRNSDVWGVDRNKDTISQAPSEFSLISKRVNDISEYSGPHPAFDSLLATFHHEENKEWSIAQGNSSLLLSYAKELSEKCVGNAKLVFQNLNQSHEYFQSILKAECGLVYNPLNGLTKNKQSWVVHFVGNLWSEPGIIKPSGCPDKCPLHPNCQLVYTPSFRTIPNVMVVAAHDSFAVEQMNKIYSSELYKVIYWREAKWPAPSTQIQLETDFEMGIHFWAGIIVSV
jgi:hypothetical protein